MNLLFTRSQNHSRFFSLVPLRIGGTVTFKLKAELELTEEEKTLMRKYSFENSSLIYSNAYDDLARSFRPAWLLAFIAMIIAAIVVAGTETYLIREKIVLMLAVPAIGIFTVIIMTLVYFFSLRKNITVSQLLNGGRTFYCHSVVDLDEQEEELKDLSERLHATLEKAKNWGGREINPIPDGEPFYLPDTELSKKQSTLEKVAVAPPPKPASAEPATPHPFASRPTDTTSNGS